MKNLRRICKNCIFHFLRNLFEEKIFWNKLWGHRFCSSFDGNIFSRFVKIAIYFSQRNIVGEREKVNSKKKTLSFITFFWTSGEKFIWKTFPSKHQKEQFARKLLFEKDSSIQKFFRVSDEKFLAGLSKLHSISSEEHLWRTPLFEKNCRFIDFLRTSGKKRFNRFGNLALFYSRGTFYYESFSLRKIFKFRNIFDFR